jgi:hypothetical protein
MAGVASRRVGLDLCPERFVRRPDLTRYSASHLRWQAVLGPHLLIAGTLQGLLVAHLAMCKRRATDGVQGITVRQLGASQRLELDSLRMQFQFGRDELFHTKQYITYSQDGQITSICEG